MAKRYYNLEKETKAFLKRMEETRGVLPDGAGIQRVNDYIVRRKGLGLIYSTRSTVSQVFDGINTQRLRVSSNSSLQVKPAWEIAAWILPRLASGTQEIVNKAQNAPSAFEFSLSYRSGAFSHQFSNGSSYGQTSSKTAAINNWYFLRLGRDSSTNNVFISQNNDTPATASQATQAVGSADFSIGDWQDGNRPGNCLVDSVARWDRLLTTAERSFLFNSGRGVSFFEVLAYQPSLLTDLVSYWQLSEGSGIRYDWWGNNLLSPNFTLTTTTGIIDKFF
jgi:hypothetical protein